MNPWWGVDFDGTLAVYNSWNGPAHTGAPIPKMVERVKRWLAEGREVRIVTARVFPIYTVRPTDNIDQVLARVAGYEPITSRHQDALEAVLAIQMWCKEHLGQVLTITCVKDYGMVELWDDRAIQVIANTGTSLRESVNLTTGCKHNFIYTQGSLGEFCSDCNAPVD